MIIKPGRVDPGLLAYIKKFRAYQRYMDGRLDHLDETEWWDVCQRVRPDVTRDEFEEQWREFEAMKRARRLS